MRPSLAALAASLFLGACVSGTRVVYVPVPASGTTQAASKPAPAPAPAPRPVEVTPPVAVTIVQADQGRLLVSLDRPSYLAVFDIAPGRGVTLLYPTSARQRQVTLVGARWLDPRWGSLGRYDAASRGSYVRNRSSLLHYVYAVASDRPLRLSDAAFDDDLLANMLGVRATRVEDPYDTRDAIVRRFVAATRDEDWGEDMYAMDAMRSSQVVRVARVYCADGTVIYVREDSADRSYCPRTPATNGATWRNRPDSVVAWNGRPVPHTYDPNARTPVYRIPRTVGGHAIGQAAGGRENGNKGNNGKNGNKGNNADHPPAAQAGGGVQQQGQPQGNSPGNSQGNAQGNAHANPHSNTTAPGNTTAPNNNKPKGDSNGQGQAHQAQSDSQPAAQPAAAPDTAAKPLPTDIRSILKRAKEKSAPAKKPSAR